jgi:hypothetical protein
MKRAALQLTLAGAVVGPLLDAIHTHTGTTVYTSPHLLGIAWWTPPLFAFAGLSVGLLRPWLERFSPDPSPPTAARLAGSGSLFVAAYAWSGLGPAKCAALATLFVVQWLAFDRTRVGLATALAAGLVGPALEVGLVHAGTFRHLAPDVLGVPFWLPWLYASGAVAWGLVGSRLTVDSRARSVNSRP